jgi:large conductance mechanosensitive channel
MKSLIEEFRSFILKGNVITLAVGVIIGGAFGKIVDSMVKDIITPIIGLVGGTPDFSGIAIGARQALDAKTKAPLLTEAGKPILEGGIMLGNFINASISFLIMAAVVFFLIVKPYNTLMARFEKKEEPKPAGPPPATLDDVVSALKELKR